MQGFLLEFHSIFRWVVLLAAVGALVVAAMVMSGSRAWDGIADRLSLIYTIALDVQFLIGAILWASEQRWSAFDPFLSLAHPLLMFAAVAVAHIGRARSERVADDRQRGRLTLIFFGLSLIIIIAAIPLYSWPL